MPKWVKALLAVGLLPFCVGLTNGLVRVIRASGHADMVWVALGAGFACWIAVYLLLPKPMWIYVFGHELTHVLWTWLFGGRVKRFRATSKGGHVVVTRTNFLIALAPYFFPIYAMGIVAVFALGRLLFGWRAESPYFHLLLGAAYGFHVTLTWHVLKRQQSDVSEHGYFFSGVILWLMNVGVLVVGISMLTGVRVLTALRWSLTESKSVIDRLQSAF